MTKTERTDLMRKATTATLEGYEDRMWGNQGHGTAEQAAAANDYHDSNDMMATAYMRGWNRADAHTELRPSMHEAAAKVLKLSTTCGAIGYGEGHTDTEAVVNLVLRYADAVSDDTEGDGTRRAALNCVINALMDRRDEE